ncbi:MAG: peroxidase family protein [Mycobacterium sp.]|nr:peroxidase family protein [Mycobacterium sp.]
MGRVGALAVALGIGGALASIPWAAAADDSDVAASADRASSAVHVRSRTAAARALPAPSAAVSVAGAAQSQSQQALPPQPKPPKPGVIYRSIDGSGNNLADTGLNAVGADFSRIGVAHFADGVSTLRTDLPNARTVSNLVVAGDGATTPNAEGLSGMMYAWGQFIDHDINLTLSDNVTHIDIAVPADDPTLSGSISLTRSVIDPLTGVAGKPATTTNNVTGWIDGSMVYGSDAATAASLRGAGGYLLTSDGNNLPIVDGAYVAGDIRVQENPDLTALQTLFLREHNRQVDQLKLAHPDWTGDQLYEQARAIVTAEIAHITYNEFLPHLLGANAIKPYRGYKADVDASLTEEFAGAAYRLGHSIVSANLEKTDEQGNIIGTAVTLKDAFFQDPADFAADSGADGLLRHLSNDLSNALDVHIVDDLRNFLFGPSAGLDLAAINLQRGRDLGLGTLNETRSALGLKPYTGFEQITSDATTAAALQAAYGDVNKVELWIGGLAEDHTAGAMVGQTFGVIIAAQFEALRDGDRLWYQNQGFDPITMREIEGTTLSSLMLQNTDTEHMQSDAFVFYERRSGQTGGGVMENPASHQLVVVSDGGDILVGGTKADLLVAGTGRQTMTGAAGGDTFIISGTGVDAVITDFKIGQDRLQFENLGKTGLKIVSENGNAVIYLGGSKVTLRGVSAAKFKQNNTVLL